MKFISYILSLFFVVIFFSILLIFHPLQWIGLKISQNTHQKVVDIMNWFLIKSLLVLGVCVKFKNEYKLPENKTLIFVSNHQSMFDIPPIIWYFRKHYPKFVSKIELSRGIPSISFNLKYGGACLIDRKDHNQAIKALSNFGKQIHNNNWSAAIFPEGTRSRNGVPKKFIFGGLKTIIAHNPNTYIVPISVNNSWKIFRYGKFPLGVFSPIIIETHEPISLKSNSLSEVLKLTEQKVKSKIII